MGLSEKTGYRSQNDESAKRRASHSASGLREADLWQAMQMTIYSAKQLSRAKSSG
jgi:hypothetical protein